jgi:hypothetical protein
MTQREIALNALKGLRNDNVWAKLDQEFPRGADVAGDVAKLLGLIVSTIGNALPEPFCVYLDRDLNGIIGLIVCPDAMTTQIVPLRLRESIVVVEGEPIFTGRSRGRDALRLTVLNIVVRELERELP